MFPYQGAPADAGHALHLCIRISLRQQIHGELTLIPGIFRRPAVYVNAIGPRGGTARLRALVDQIALKFSNRSRNLIQIITPYSLDDRDSNAWPHPGWMNALHTKLTCNIRKEEYNRDRYN